MDKRYTLRKTAAGAPRIAYEKELNPEQLRVVTSGEGPALVLAGPGSGKTRTLTYRVSYLLEQGVPPQAVLLVTFTVKAAREMLGRVERILKYRPEGLWGGTFHHIGNLVLRRHADLLRRTPAFGILDQEDAKDLMASILADLKFPASHTRLPQAGVVESILSLAVNTCRSIEQVVLDQYPQFAEHVPWMERVRSAYQERKQKGNVMDYDDLLAGWLTVLREHPDVLRRYGDQFQHILVDEYQDTNRLQFELIRTLGLVRGNVLAVGDDAQSIYGFRGAEVRNLLQFPEVFSGASIYRLETNYRSTPEVLRLANTSIRFNSAQFPKELKSVQESGPLPVVVPLVDARQQAAFVAQRALELREEGVPLEEMAVLFRARFQAAELELELAKRNIPYIVRGGIRFFEQAHIKDVLAFLRLLANPMDEMAWERVLRLQDGIGAGYARRIWASLTASPDPLQAALQGRGGESIPAKAQAGLKRLQGTLRGLTNPARRASPSELLLEVLRSGYESYLETHFEDARNRKEDLEQLVNLASSYNSVERFIEDLTLREPFRGETIKGWEEPDELLVLSTIHQAKGLEWSAVFLIGLSEGQFPHPKSLEDTAQMEEERRLFYVAVTRTKKDLYLTYPLTRYNYQRGETILRPSQFLQELPEDLMELWRVGEELKSPDYF
ncbi:MAG: UvrD-helicase domain-containing protein [Candidatus Omnitrophica bacterium]|nr:UvrD-helicase domain-containing protein [Candidatus Omnitrophota bacterium]